MTMWCAALRCGVAWLVPRAAACARRSSAARNPRLRGCRAGVGARTGAVVRMASRGMRLHRRW
jgi:hypothetical protein